MASHHFLIAEIGAATISFYIGILIRLVQMLRSSHWNAFESNVERILGAELKFFKKHRVTKNQKPIICLTFDFNLSGN